jgi:signal transduction histidine kinase
MSTLLPSTAPPLLATVPLAAPPGLFAVAGWVVAVLALAAAVVLRRAQDHRLALVAEAAHELRGPLCAARLGLHALESAGEPVARRAAAVELELRRAGLALDDLAAAPHGRRTSDRLELVDAGALLVGAALGWSAVARVHGARLRVEGPCAPALVRGDRLRLAQALGNLVANAAEHGGGEVAVRGVVCRDAVRLEVSDEGPGLPASVSQLVAAGRTARGPRGHGLAVAARIAARHGGRLASAPSARGARLVLELPLARPEPRPPLRADRSAGVFAQRDGAASPLGHPAADSRDSASAR